MSDSTKHEAIIDRIRALFARTVENGCTKAEAITAALAARRLIVRYGITDSELSEQQTGENVTEVEAASVCTSWSAHLAATVAASYEAVTAGNGCYCAKSHVTYRSAFDRGRSDGREASRSHSVEGQLGLSA